MPPATTMQWLHALNFSSNHTMWLTTTTALQGLDHERNRENQLPVQQDNYWENMQKIRGGVQLGLKGCDNQRSGLI